MTTEVNVAAEYEVERRQTGAIEQSSVLAFHDWAKTLFDYPSPVSLAGLAP